MPIYRAKLFLSLLNNCVAGFYSHGFAIYYYVKSSSFTGNVGKLFSDFNGLLSPFFWFLFWLWEIIDYISLSKWSLISPLSSSNSYWKFWVSNCKFERLSLASVFWMTSLCFWMASIRFCCIEMLVCSVLTMSCYPVYSISSTDCFKPTISSCNFLNPSSNTP